MSGSIESHFTGAESITLPCRPDQLGNFISDLLLTPNRITGRHSFEFYIDAEGVKNFYHIIDQRVADQHHHHEISFRIDVFYNDGTSYTINSISEFDSYVEVSPKIVNGLTMEWVYLIQFPGYERPQKQQISVYLRGGHIYDTDDISEVVADHTVLRRAPRREGGIRFEILHTSRSFGIDIENLLRSHVKKLQILGERNAFYERISAPAGWLLFLCLILGGVAVWRVVLVPFLWDLYGISSDMDTDQFIRAYLISGVSTDITFISLLYYVLTIAAAIALSIWTAGWASPLNKSFIVLNAETKARYERDLRADSRMKSFFWCTIVAGVGCSLMANAIWLWF